MIEFTIIGEPVAKGRPRASIIGRPPHQHVHIYTPAETEAAEQAFRLLARKYRPRKPLTGPLKVDTIFVVTPPQSFPKDRSRLWPHVKPDDDNYRKLAIDAMNGEFFHDDGQVCGGESYKVYGSPARTVVRIRPLTLEDYERVAGTIGQPVAQPALFGGAS